MVAWAILVFEEAELRVDGFGLKIRGEGNGGAATGFAPDGAGAAKLRFAGSMFTIKRWPVSGVDGSIARGFAGRQDKVADIFGPELYRTAG